MSIRVPGTGAVYASVDELADAIAELERLREVEVSDLRAEGREGEADRVSDRYGRQIAAHQAALRNAQERKAQGTRQPQDRPRPTRRQLARKAVASRRRRNATRGLSLRSGFSGRVLRETGATGGYYSATRVALEVLGLLFGLALVIVVLEGEGPRGGPFSDLFGHGLRFLGWLVGPIDPFTGSSLAPPPPPPARSNAPSRPSTKPARPAAGSYTA